MDTGSYQPRTLSRAVVERLLASGAALALRGDCLVLVPRLRGARGPGKSEVTRMQTGADLMMQMGDQLRQLTGQYNQMGQQWNQLGTGWMEQARQAFAPVEKRALALASGDRTQMVAAAAPELENIAQQYAAARETASLMPKGVAADYFSMRLPTMQAAETARALNRAYSSAFDQLGQLGSAYGSMGIQSAGIGQGYGELTGRGTQAAANIYGQSIGAQQLVNEAMARKKSGTLGALTSVAGLAAAPFTGGASLSLSGLGSLSGLFSKKPAASSAGPLSGTEVHL